MPKKDGTGPCGKGPRTGRGMGDCPSDQKGRGGYGQRSLRGEGRNNREFEASKVDDKIAEEESLSEKE